MEISNPYEVLQLSETASTEQIRQRYLLLTRTFHPDKQPFQNYYIAKQYFERIDKAYKAISTPLRKYIYAKFGMTGIDIIQENKSEFLQFQDRLDQEQAKKQIEELINYFYFWNVAETHEQQTQTQGASYLNLTYVFKDRRYAVIDKNFVSHSAMLPQFFKFQNNFVASFGSSGTGCNLGIQVDSITRVMNDTLLVCCTKIDERGISGELSMSKLLANSYFIKFTPIIVQNMNLQPLKVALEKDLSQKYHFSCETNLNELSINISTSERLINKYLQLEANPQSNAIGIGYQMPFSPNCRIFTNLRLNGQVNSQNQLMLNLSCNYGIKLKFGRHNGIELKSSIGQQNYMQIRLERGNNKLNIPFLCGSLNLVSFQAFKLGIMILIYAAYRIQRIIDNRNQAKKNRLHSSSFERLTDERSKLSRLIEEISNRESQILDFQIATNGLVILKALYGNSDKLKFYSNKYKNESFDFTKLQQQCQRFRTMDSGHFLNNQIQIIDITKILQNQVKGAQIQDFTLNIYNPCLEQEAKPALYVKYYLRGKLYQNFFKNITSITIGKPKCPPHNIFGRFYTWLKINKVF